MMSIVNAFLKKLPAILAENLSVFISGNIFSSRKKEPIKFGTEFAVVVVSIRYQLTFILTLILVNMNIKPLADRVLVKPAAAEEKTVSGIIIPDTAKEKPLRGEVIAVGKGTKDEEMVVKEGDNVLYGKYAGTEIEIEGVKHLIMRQSDILAILS